MIGKKLTAVLLLTTAFTSNTKAEEVDTRWGDQGDGTFANPVLFTDYSDPDVIRVGNKYYMTGSEFHYMGMQILESDDMINWRIIGQVYDRINQDIFRNMSGYGDGTWAPALRYHDGRFYIYVCMPTTGLYMTSAEKPEGPWEPLYCVKQINGWEDPCPLWDDNGNAYLGRGRVGAGAIIVHRMSSDGKTLLDDGKVVYEGPVAEGTKYHIRDGYYYLSIPEGGVGQGWQTVLRSKDIYGPYEGKRVLETGSTNINGPHQGALVDTPDGEWWFYHFQERVPQGRVVHLQPVKWPKGEFPTIGEDYDGNGIGEPMKIVKKPNTGKKCKPFHPQTDDKFQGGKLGLQWQVNHNPVSGCISTTQRKGMLSITALKADQLSRARNTVTQKTLGYKGEATVMVDYSDILPGQRMGMACLGSNMAGAGVEMISQNGKEKVQLYFEKNGDFIALPGIDCQKKCVWFRLSIDGVQNKHRFSYSTDGKNFTSMGSEFDEYNSGWKGSRVGLYTYSCFDKGGTAYFDNFEYKVDGPGKLK